MVDLTADADTEEEGMHEAPATPSPNVSDGSDMDTAYNGVGRDGDGSSDEDGFQHVLCTSSISVHRAVYIVYKLNLESVWPCGQVPSTGAF